MAASSSTSTLAVTSTAAAMPADANEEDVLTTSLRSCANDPDFAVICAFLGKFARDLGLDLPNFRHLQEWITNTDEVSQQLRDLHIKLLRKTRKTVHEKSWESALSKFCFTYSAQDAWEVERFGYKKSSLKVKLRIFRALLESQFERNGKFRSKLLTFSADSLRSQPIGRDRLGHSYWLTQDSDCNLRVYQEHLDEEIWQVVATNRDELVNLIARLRGNEVVLPSSDIGIVDEDTSSSNSNAPLQKPPPPEEQDDSLEEETKVPNLRIKLMAQNGKAVSAGVISKGSSTEEKEIKSKGDSPIKVEESIDSVEEEDYEGEEEEEEEDEGEEQEQREKTDSEKRAKSKTKDMLKGVKLEPLDSQKRVKPLVIPHSKITANSPCTKKRSLDDLDKSSPSREETVKKLRPTLLDSKRVKKPSRYEKAKSEEEATDEDDDGGEEGVEEEGDEEEEIEDEGEEEDGIEDDDGVGEEGEEEDIDSVAAEEDENEEKDIEDDDDDDVGEAIDDPTLIIRGTGAGKECEGNNPQLQLQLQSQPQHNEEFLLLLFEEVGNNKPITGDVIEEEIYHIFGAGSGEDSLVGNTKNASETSTPQPAEPKATFFFGEPGCLKLSPMKQAQAQAQALTKTQTESQTPKVETEKEKDNLKQEEQQEDKIVDIPKKIKETKKDDIEGVLENETINEDKEKKLVTTEKEFEKCEIDEKKDIKQNTPKEENIKEVKEIETEENEIGNLKLNEKIKIHEEPQKDFAHVENCDVKKELVLEINGNSRSKGKDADEQVQEYDKEKETQTNAKTAENKEIKINIENRNNVEEKGEDKAGEEDKEGHKQEQAQEREQVQEQELEKKSNKEQTEEFNVSETKQPCKDIALEVEKSNNMTEPQIKPEKAPSAIKAIEVSPKETLEAPKPRETPFCNSITTNSSEANVLQDTKTSLISVNDSTANKSKGPGDNLKADNLAVLKSSNSPTFSPCVAANPLTSIGPPHQSRKRRLADFSAHRYSTSESEFEFHGEGHESTTVLQDKLDDDLDDVGGKRLKIRPKLTNTELRRKVEEQKDAIEDTTSSSGEDDPRRRRKLFSPKQQISQGTYGETMGTHGIHPDVSDTIEMLEKLQKEEKTPEKQKEQTQLYTTITHVGSKCNEMISRKSIASSGSHTLPKHKPTLAEIIEKKLKKTSPNQKTSGTLELSEKPTEKENDVDIPSSIFSPPKKSPITKPLKKNLLTQLRQEESDEETIPRKRTISDTVAVNVAVNFVDKNNLKGIQRSEEDFTLLGDQEVEKRLEPVLSEVPLVRKTPERKTPERKTSERKTPERKTPERKTPERQRKRRSSEEVTGIAQKLPEPTAKNESISEKLKKNNEDELVKATLTEEIIASVKKVPVEIPVESEMKDVKKEATSVTPLTLPPVRVPVEETTSVTVGRRSGRRGGATVLYTELPQPKRTRGGAKTAAKKVGRKEEPAEMPKKEQPFAEEVSANVKKEEPVENVLKVEKVEIAIQNDGAQNKSSNSAVKGLKEKEKENDKEPKSISTASALTASQKDTPEKEEQIKDVSLKEADTAAVSVTPKASGSSRGRGRKKREVDTTNIIDSTDETPVRQSRRIAQQKIREEAERRKLEEIALRTMKQELKKKKKAEKEADPTVVIPSEHSSSSSDQESEVETTKKKAKKKCPGRDGWSSGSEEQEEPEEEDEEPPHYETDPGSPLFKSDHEFSPESDLEDESQVVPMKRARTARKEDAEEGEDVGDEEACQKCGKSDHPEWILLCDKCDKGYHCSCLSPVLFYIPEGDWYCPPCQQEQLIAALEYQLKEFDELVAHKRQKEEEEKRLAEETERAEKERLAQEQEEKQKRKSKKQKQKQKQKQKNKRRSADRECRGDDGSESDSVGSERTGEDDDDDDDDDDENDDDEDDNEDDKTKNKIGSETENEEKEEKRTKKLKHVGQSDKAKRRRGDGRSSRRAATRGARRRRRQRDDSGSSDGSNRSNDSSSRSDSSSSSSSSSATDSDDEPIYKLRKRRQINVSYRLNEFDDLINSALKKEMDEVAGAGNLGRGKDITTIIEADKEEKARQKQLEEANEEVEELEEGDKTAEGNKDELKVGNSEFAKKENKVVQKKADTASSENNAIASDEDDEPIKRKPKMKSTIKKKPRKLTTLDISSEEDDASDEDFKTSSLDEEDEEDEDTSISVSTDSDSSLEVYRRRNKNDKRKKKQRKAARRAARERRKDRRFVVEESDEEDEVEQRPKSKKKRKEESDYTESETGDEDDEVTDSENVDSADLCDDTTSDDSDGAWHPSKRKKQRKSNATIARKSPKLKKPQTKKPKRAEYSDDDISETEEEDEDDDDDLVGKGGKGGLGSGKQPRSQPLKSSPAAVKSNNKTIGKGKGKSVGPAVSKKKKKKFTDDEDSFSSGSEERFGRTRGRRYAYLEDFDDDSSEGGIKPGVKRPDTPPEERQKFIQRQEEIKRMLAEKNAEGAKLAATPRLTPIKGAPAISVEKDKDKDKRSPAKASDSLSTVPLSVIRQAKVLDIDYLQRKGEAVDNVDSVESEFDDADLPDDFPEDMDEDAIARMVDEDVFDAAAAARELPAADDVVRASTTSGGTIATGAGSAAAVAVTTKVKVAPKEPEKPAMLGNPALTALAQMPGASHSGLQEPLRKRLPMPTMHPPLLRHQFPPHSTAVSMAAAGMSHHMHLMQRHPGAPPSHLLQNALSAPLNRNFPLSQRLAGVLPPVHALPPHLLPGARQPLPASQPLLSAATAAAAAAVAAASGVGVGGSTVNTVVESETKPRGRRKKITPLRDTLQKQQTAAAVSAVSAASSTSAISEKSESPAITSMAPVTIAASGGVIKSTPPTISTSVAPLSIVQPPQLYKGGSGAGAGAGPSELHPSVITRMPHLPLHSTASPASGGVRPSSGGPLPHPGGLYTPGAEARFYGPPQQGLMQSARPPPNTAGGSQRHRVPSQMPPGLPPHSSMRPTYGPPPPLRGSLISPSGPPNGGQAPISTAPGGRSSYPPVGAPGDHHAAAAAAAAALSAVYGAPPPARHTAPHLNPYRPLIYGNPNFTHRGAPPPGANLRPGSQGVPGPGAEYAAGPRGFPPYGYYPPPPPLTTAHGSSAAPPASLPPTSSTPHSTQAAPSSVIVAAPSATSVVLASAAGVGATKAVISPNPNSSAPPPNNITTTTIRSTATKSPSPTALTNSKHPMEPRKRLTTLEAYSTTSIKSPLAIGGESSGSHSSPGMQPDGTEDSSSAPNTNIGGAMGATTTAATEGQASEFSGLVSYFSSQHDDYNT